MFFNFYINLILVLSFLLWILKSAFYIYARISSAWCKSNTCLRGKTVLITGGNSGIGYQTALVLAGRGCRLIIADKDFLLTKEKIIRETGNTNIVLKQFDLSSLASVRKLAADINDTEPRLDILINNAGASGLKNSYTKDGLHIGMQVNHFGTFLLTHLLLDLLKKSAPSRIIFNSSFMSFTNNLTLENLNYPEQPPATPKSEFLVYSNSKLCILITAKVLAKKLEETGVTVNSLHPGVVYTDIYRNHANYHSKTKIQIKMFYMLLSCFAKTPEEGAQTMIHLAIDKEVEEVSGKYFVECKIHSNPKKADDDIFCNNIFGISERLVQLKDNEKLI